MIPILRNLSLLLLMMASLALSACGGGGGGSNDDDDDSAPNDDDSTPKEFDVQGAEEVALDVVSQLQTQQNLENLSNLQNLVPQAVRGRVAKIAQEIVVNPVPCATMEINDLGGGAMEMSLVYEGQCELEGVVYTGSMYLSMSGGEQNGTMVMEFENFSTDGSPPMNGAMTMEFSTTSEGMETTMTFEGFETEDGAINGSMYFLVSNDGTYSYFEFEDFSTPEGVLDGYFEMTTDNATTVSVTMELNGTMGGDELGGSYTFTMTDNLDGTYAFSGEGTFDDPDLGEIHVEYDYTMDPAGCGDIPSDGWMYIEQGGDSFTATFTCIDIIVTPGDAR